MSDGRAATRARRRSRGGATERQEAGAAKGAAAPFAAPVGEGMSDAELLRRHIAGDAEAFGELFRRHKDRLWAVALRTLGDPEEAADALQDAMISAFRRASSFRGDSAVTTWLHRIVVNACLDRMRRRAARPATTGTDQQALDIAAVARALPALRMLPLDQQAALVLVDMLGYPVADAAEALGVSVGTVKSRCSRGRVRLLPHLAHLRRNQSGPPRVQPSQEGGSDQP